MRYLLRKHKNDHFNLLLYKVTPKNNSLWKVFRHHNKQYAAITPLYENTYAYGNVEKAELLKHANSLKCIVKI